MASDFVVSYPTQNFPDSLATPLPPNRDVTCFALPDRCICGCDGGACIPQREYQTRRTDPPPQHYAPEIILFSVNGKCGYPLKDALMEQCAGLDGSNDKIFVDLKSASIAIRLEWLPYQGWTRQIRTSNQRRSRDDITLAKLATQVARRMSLFCEEMRDEVADPQHLHYRFQPGIIDLDHLELVALKRVCKYSYMPHFRLVAP